MNNSQPLCFPAVTDLIVGAFVMPLNVDYLLNNSQWRRGPHLCHAWLLTDTVVSTASIWNLVAVAVDRWMASQMKCHFLN